MRRLDEQHVASRNERRDLIGALIDCAFVLPSAVRYLVLKNGDNYSGARLAQNPLLVP